MRPGSGATYDEAWLQQLIQEHPSLLPIGMIEPALQGPIPICMELPVPSGFVDNLMITADGGIVVVETKLWRNPEARREVIGQVLDYAKDLSRLSLNSSALFGLRAGSRRLRCSVWFMVMAIPTMKPHLWMASAAICASAVCS